MSYLEFNSSKERVAPIRSSSGAVNPICGRAGTGVGSFGSFGSFGAEGGETPVIRTLPWNIDTVPTKAELKAERSEARWSTLEKLGAVLGILLSAYSVSAIVRKA